MNLPDNRFFKTIFSKEICSIINFKVPGKIVQHVDKKRVWGNFLFHKTFPVKDISRTITPNILALFPKCSGKFSKYFTTKWLVHFKSHLFSFNLICVWKCRYLQFIQNMPHF